MIVVVPMAGRGSRMAGFGLPKPLVPVAGRPMVAWALESLQGIAYRKIVFIALAEHEHEHRVTWALREIVGRDVDVALLPDVTAGQLCTVLAVKDLIDQDEDLLIASSDTLVVSDLGTELRNRKPDCRGIISVADMPGDRWSFARIDATGRVVEVAEKVRISSNASTGLYYFASGREFVEVGEAIVRNRELTGGEYYIIPVYQKYIDSGRLVELSHASRMWDLGTPEAKKAFEAFRRASERS